MAKAPKAPHAPRNSTLPGGISRLGRAAVYGKRALYKRKKVAKKPASKDTASTKVKQVGGDKNGKQRTVALVRESRFYPTEDVKRPLRHRKTPRQTKLRSTLTPGTVVILLAGRHRGKVGSYSTILSDSIGCIFATMNNVYYKYQKPLMITCSRVTSHCCHP